MNATHALGWALVHFLWQGAALAFLLGIALALTRPTAARTRYALSLLTLAAMLVLPVATAARLYEPGFVGAPAVMTTSSPTDPIESSPARQESRSRSPALISPVDRIQPAASSSSRLPSIAQVRAWLEPMLPWLVVVWVVGVLLLSVRTAHGWLAARRLRTLGTRDISEALEQVLARLAARLRVSRPVQLLESMIVEVPAVIGWLKPVILVPASALSGLTPQQLEVLLAH
jgi:beta-lactamase regulating signal transducer with metallopeptidase domain